MLKNKQISDLEASIARRKNLLSNENYLNKAPKELVEKEKNTLKDEEEIKQRFLKDIQPLRLI